MSSLNSHVRFSPYQKHPQRRTVSFKRLWQILTQTLLVPFLPFVSNRSWAAQNRRASPCGDRHAINMINITRPSVRLFTPDIPIIHVRLPLSLYLILSLFCCRSFHKKRSISREIIEFIVVNPDVSLLKTYV